MTILVCWDRDYSNANAALAKGSSRKKWLAHNAQPPGASCQTLVAARNAPITKRSDLQPPGQLFFSW
jgi:hypothetical protein